MNQIIIKIDRGMLRADVQQDLVAGSVGVVRAAVEFDSSWEGFARTLVFSAGDHRERVNKAVLVTEGQVEVPWEVLEKPGMLWISAVGIGDGTLQPTARMAEGLVILPSGEITGGEPGENTPAVWQQALNQMHGELEQVQVSAAAAEAAMQASEAAAGSAQASARQAAGSETEAKQSQTAAEQAGAEAKAAALQSQEAAAQAQTAREEAVAAAEMAGGGNRVAEVVLTAAGWSAEAPYVQSVAVEGMTAQWVPGYPVLIPRETMEQDQAAREAWGCVCKIESGDGVLTFACYTEKPGVDLHIRVPDML